ncbi:hypothetical protein GF386_03840 [Candidatus Pacearchaeota archaeon]|nr:hypothetical protein [Candidatus Pacearchaeota archaeon]MBD3283278.1 hypothetical protein [Candidatus Pacearchaeota archaeon]
MVELRYRYGRAEPLGLVYHLEKPAVFCGMDRRDAMDYSGAVRARLDSFDEIPFVDFIDLSAEMISDRDIRRKYAVLYNYLKSVYAGEIREPFFVFIGGTASSGKDTLVMNLGHYLHGFDRVTNVDKVRERARTELEDQYRGRIPRAYQPIFERLTSLDKSGIQFQNQYVQGKLREWEIDEVYRECNKSGGFHPWYAFQGINVSPGFESSIEGLSKILVILSPPADFIGSRVSVRQEKEQRLARLGDLSESDRSYAERQLELEHENSFRYRGFLEKEALRRGTPLITQGDELGVLQNFADYFIDALEKANSSLSYYQAV